MPTPKDRATLSEQPSTTNQADLGSKELPMPKTTSLRTITITIATCATLVLVLTGIRCTSATPPAPANTPKIPVYTQKTVYDKVVWPASTTVNQAALAAIPAEEREKIKLSGVPVLVPGNVKLLENAVVSADSNGSSAGSAEPIDGVDYTIISSRVGVQSENPALNTPQAQEEQPGRNHVAIDHNDANTLVARWSEHGQVSYMVMFDCLNPADPRCTSDDYLADLVKNLVYVGGSGQ